MSRICLCLTGRTLTQDLEILDKNRKYVDIAELRVDCLDPDEHFQIRRFPEQAGIPVILTIRRDMDGGFYHSGEGSRITLFSKALAFAEADRRKNFAFVDMEEDLNVPSLEEAARTFGTRIIRSCHNREGIGDDLVKKLKSLRHVGDEIPKIALTPRSMADVVQVYRAAGEAMDFDKILLCMGHYGINTRILAEQMGSYLSYTSATDEPEIPQAAPGHISPRNLAEVYRFREITPKTRIFGITGYPLKATSSPVFFNKVFTEEHIDAVYVPFPSDSPEAFLELAAELKLAGASVTVPYKERIISHLTAMANEVKALGACNTIIPYTSGWIGYNTDAGGFSDSLLQFIDRKNLRGCRITIIGAGGAARAVASEVYRLRGKALILNRTTVRAKELALPYHFSWGCTDNQGAVMMEKFSDIIIQTTPVGMEGDIDGDPMPEFKFYGREKVMDLIYKPERTPFLKRAMAAGCSVLNGYDMFLSQARYQYRYFMGREFPSQLISRIQF
ncbi:MAG: type I 3-dehydroquinate dehydratase [Spirochaetaceae bacterium]|jgi:3-dehydroquinate dehydratase/shikimate dehydrogenase|nr:type I 3-dehydroquinate dehydratase [Spirochaetaceae bacterium]